MLKRVIGVTAIIVIAAVGVYGFIWYKHASNVKQRTHEIIARMELPYGEAKKRQRFITYEDLSVSGFPFSVKLSFQDVVVNVPSISYRQEFHIPEIVAIQDVKDVTQINVDIAKEWEINFFDLEAAKGAEPLLTTIWFFEEKPTASLSVGSESQVKGLIAKSVGRSVALNSKDNIIFTEGKMDIALEVKEIDENRENTSLKMTCGPSFINTAIEPKALPAIIKPYYDLLRKAGPSTCNIDVNWTAPKDFKKVKGIPEVSLMVEDYRMEASNLAFKAYGSFETQPFDLFPFGELTFDIKNLPLVVDILGTFLGDASFDLPMVGSSSDGEGIFSKSRLPLLETFIRKVAGDNKETIESDNVVWNVKREQGKQLTVNNKTLPEVIAIAQEVYGQSEAKKGEVNDISGQGSAQAETPDN